MSKLNDVGTEAAREIAGYCAMTAGGLAINAGSAATFKTVNTVAYLSNGIFKSKTAFTAQTFTAGHVNQAIGETGYYVVGLSAAGAVSTYQGIGAIPDVPDGITPIGIIKVVSDSAIFNPDTTALDAASQTVTFYDVSVLPATQTL